MDEYPKHASSEAHLAIDSFSKETLSLNPEALRQRGEQVAATLRLFAANRLPDPAYDAAFLLPLFRHAYNGEEGQSDAAAWALTDYLTNPENEEMRSPEAVNYMLHVMGDFKAIDAAVFDYQDRINEEVEKRNSHIGRQVLRAVNIEDDLPITAELWGKARAGVNVPKLKEITHEVNVESLIIGAAELLDDLMYEKNPRKQFDNIFKAETLFCPALEAFGMWGMDTALRNAVNRIRLVNAGREDLIEKANDVLTPIKRVGQEEVFKGLFGAPLSEERTRYHLDNQTPYGATIHLFDTNLDVGLDVQQSDGTVLSQQVDARVISRIKGVESLAMKMYENEDYKEELPVDLVGMTIIVNGEAQLAAMFNKLVRQVESLENSQFKAAASKNEALFVKGGADFISSLKQKISPELLDRIEFKQNGESTSAFQVVKMTLVMEIDDVDIPVEIQLQTALDRERAEVGDSPHFEQKTKHVPKGMPGNIKGSPETLAEIRDRKRKWLGLDKTIVVVDDGTPWLESFLFEKIS